MRIAIARYIKSPDNYFFDIFDAVTAGTLKAAGHDVIVAERIGARGFDEDTVFAGLVSFVADFLPDLVLLPYLPSQQAARALRHATGAPLAAFGSRMMLQCPDLDYVIEEPDPLACADLVQALEGTRDLRNVAALWYRDHGRPARADAPLHPIFEIFTAGRLDYAAFYRLGPGRPAEVRKHVVGDWGCPFRHANPSPVDSRGEPVFAGGCSFCTRPAWTPTPWEVKQDLLSLQLDAVLAHFPDCAKLILVDEFALSYIDDLAKLLATKPAEGIDLLVSGRLDHVERHRDRLENALHILAPTNRICLYQLGIENLADSVLARYNKGLTFEDVRRSAAAIRQLLDRFPSLGIEQSFGFIMFDPWTTLDELRLNVQRAPSLGLEQFRGEAPFTSLRLFPETPLYWKALNQGLLTGTVDDNDFGYSVNSGWRFAHPHTAAIYSRLLRLRGTAHPWTLLADATGQ